MLIILLKLMRMGHCMWIAEGHVEDQLYWKGTNVGDFLFHPVSNQWTLLHSLPNVFKLYIVPLKQMFCCILKEIQMLSALQWSFTNYVLNVFQRCFYMFIHITK
ncbi:hypothetical protein UPYG_G00207130 [Umbra pygmaea]|uniref:Uncharacterized protein n=1 Tax=Umbra pygmaea TaxID=75934 RepID=A0ABD0X1C7_UMBPY